MTVLSAEERGDLAEQLLPLAAQLVTLVHGDGGPRDVHQVLVRLGPTVKDALLVVLAGLVDPDRPMGDALAWLDFDETGAFTEPAWAIRAPLRDLAPEPVFDDEDTYIDPAAVTGYLRGRRVEVSARERLAAIEEGVRRGMAYPDFDRLHGLVKGSTSTFVSRSRRAYAARGEKFPSDLQAQGVNHAMPAEQVVAIRERYAAGGVTDLELGMQYGVSSKTICNIVSGTSYRQVGGPVRPKRLNKPSASTRVVWAGGDIQFANVG